MKKVNDFYVDENNNSWNANVYTEQEAIDASKTLINCNGCSNCSYCNGCNVCRNCSYCSSCSNCSVCSVCSDCSDCRGCGVCRNCNGCSYCRDCRNCSNFKTNPQRITSPNIGSRNNQTTYYWTDEHEQIVCGCWTGTLNEFEKQVRETHGTNKFAKQYFKWIKKIKIYKS